MAPPRVVGRHQQVLVDAPVLGDDEPDAALLVQPADDAAVGALEDVDDLAFGPAAPVDADALARDAVAVQHLVHFSRRQEEVVAAVVRNEEAEAVGVPLHGAADEIELGDHAQLALAVDEQLAVALQRRDTGVEQVALLAQPTCSRDATSSGTSGMPASASARRIAAPTGSTASPEAAVFRLRGVAVRGALAARRRSGIVFDKDFCSF